VVEIQREETAYVKVQIEVCGEVPRYNTDRLLCAPKFKTWPPRQMALTARLQND